MTHTITARHRGLFFNHFAIFYSSPTYAIATLNNSTRITSNTRPQLCTFFSYRTVDCTALHFTLGIDNYTCVVFEVEIHSVYYQQGPSSRRIVVGMMKRGDESEESTEWGAERLRMRDGTSATPGFSLADYDCGHDFLSQLWFSFLYRCHHHITNTFH